jgi:hypothetical protein
MNQQTEVVRVKQVRGFQDGQNVAVTDVHANPPQIHRGTISSVWSDETAMITWHDGFVIERDKHLVVNGRVNLHWARVINA